MSSVPLAHREDGPAGAPVVVLGPSLGTTWEMWDDAAAVLAASYRVVRYDTRGHGRSPVPPGPYSIVDLAADVLDLLDSLDVAEFAMVGLSLGGAIAQQQAVTAPDRLRAAVLCCTVPRFGGPQPWAERAATVRGSGMAAIADATRQRWFTEEFRATRPEVVDRLIETMTGLDPEGYAGCCEALGGFDLSDELGRISIPVRVVAGVADPVAPPAAAEAMADAIPGADLVVVPDTSHLATVAGDSFLRPVSDFLEAQL